MTGAAWKTSLQIAVIALIIGVGAITVTLIFPVVSGRAESPAAPFHGGLVLVCIFSLVLLALCGMGLGEMRSNSTPARSAEDNESRVLLGSMGLKLELEVRALVELLRAYLSANTTYSASLSQAHQDLLASVTPDDIKIIVKYLLVENEKMEAKTANLEQSLKRSHSQMEELRTTLSEAQELSLRDPLTALCNRRYFDGTLGREIAEAKVQNTQLSLILADIDHFKMINDKFGHLVGDEVLKLFAKLLSNNVKGRDTVARFGGEEFAIVLPHTGIDNATRIAEQIRSQLEGNRWMLKQTKHWVGKITASFGIAELNKDENAEAMIVRADKRLYEAKSRGRNCVIADETGHSPMRSEVPA